MDMEPEERAVRARADLLTAIVLVALGLLVFYLSWTMPRLEARRIHPATIPGLVPMLLGGALTICGALLGLHAWRVKAPGGWRALGGIFLTSQAKRAATVLALALIYTLVLVGWLPFWAASMLFVFSFIFLFEVVETEVRANVLRTILWGLAIAIVAGAGISYVFERIFLVRLP
jgi:hypothetical protein